MQNPNPRLWVGLITMVLRPAQDQSEKPRTLGHCRPGPGRRLGRIWKLTYGMADRISANTTATDTSTAFMRL